MSSTVTGALRGAGAAKEARPSLPTRGPSRVSGNASLERIRTVVVDEHDDIARLVAGRIATLIRERQASGARAVLGLATGSTPIGVYRELIRMHREEGLSFANVVSFNLDEYYPMAKDSIHAYHRYMWENLFSHIDVDPRNVHIPDGGLPRERVEEECLRYELEIERAGGIDFQLLGIGKTGHIGFNVPREALTMGVATILGAREIAILATGEHKAAIVRRAVEGEVDIEVAATFLQRHPNTTFYVDDAAAADLTRIATPWLLDEVEWTEALMVKAVVWLSLTTGKGILKLEQKDYAEHRMSSLVARWGSPGAVNGEVFNLLGAKIRGKSKLPRGQTIVCFSPHPDDDVISMGGILHKLVQNGNAITVAYQTSGNIAVFDHDVRRFVDFMERLDRERGVGGEALRQFTGRVLASLETKQPGDVDIPEVLDTKRVIREAEAVSGIEVMGLSKANARFLNLPFYQTGKVRKDPIGPADVAIVRALLEEVRPDLILVAGDLSDPHGTHRMCKEAIDLALAEIGAAGGKLPEVWLYRGAWQEWPITEATWLVPMSQEELRTKIQAIFKHQSQKDSAPFPGQDEREFWQRVEQRNKETAATLDRLGLAEYFAMEAYVVASSA